MRLAGEVTWNLQGSRENLSKQIKQKDEPSFLYYLNSDPPSLPLHSFLLGSPFFLPPASDLQRAALASFVPKSILNASKSKSMLSCPERKEKAKARKGWNCP